MKSTHKTSAMLTSASLAAVLSVAAAFHVPASSTATNIASVTVSAKRMSAQQKLAFDLDVQGIQTVVISTKRLSAEQKLTMAQEDRAMQVAIAQKHTRTHG